MVVAIDVAGVSKQFRLTSDGATSFKERLVRRRSEARTFTALSDINVQVEVGETLGLLGHNGSGKSTLLKMIGGIMRPSAGEIRVRGRVASLLELGAGFHPELTGRENIFINGAILGLSHRELERRFDEIVEFAELEQFIDTQVRSYSSGMYMRLGFAVAVSVNPDVLLIDEVLAVGDENFQRKCLDRIAQFQHERKTIIFVGHAPDLMRRLCDRVAVLDHGHLICIGPPGESIRTFRERLLDIQLERQAIVEERHRVELAPAETDEGDNDQPDASEPGPSLAGPSSQEASRTLRVRIVEVLCEHRHMAERAYLLPGEPLMIRIRYEAQTPVDDVVFGIGIFDQRDGRGLFGINTDLLGFDLGTIHGLGEVTFQLEAVHLLDGTYPVSVGIQTHDEGTVYDWSEQRHWFEVMSPDRRVGLVALDVLVDHVRALVPIASESPTR